MDQDKFKKATFAGGCFWCMQPFFDRLKGVQKTVVGYTGGHVKNPTYQQVCSGQTGHAEAIEITFDPHLVEYEKLLDIFFHNIDPTAVNAQFADQGTQYRTAVFYHGEEQKKKAQDYVAKLAASGKFDKPIATQLVPASEFYPAEDYHQGYYKKNTFQYEMYHQGSGRVQYLDRVWGKDGH